MNDMAKNKALIQMLCLPFCIYYKPGKNEGLLCRGAVIVERLMRSGRNLLAGQKNLRVPDHNTIELAVRLLCSACDFRENDCNFAQDRHAHPCGGFVFLSRLLDTKTILAEDII
jgi:hypothetical protein